MNSRDQIFCEYGRLLQRKPMRRPGHDYSQPGHYFVTICLRNRAPIFSRIKGDQVYLTPIGSMIQSEWFALGQEFAFVKLHPYVIMPDHIHGIIEITNSGNTIQLSEMIRRFKSRSTCRYSKGVKSFGWLPFQKKLWITSFWDDILEDYDHYRNCVFYIQNNPRMWLHV
jgi:REP element-mobilizing transposase RayT